MKMKMNTFGGRLLSLLLAFTLALTCFAVLPAAAWEQGRDGPFTYRICDSSEGNYQYAMIVAADKDDSALSGVVTLPETLGGLPLEAIDALAFQLCEKMTEVVIPKSVRFVRFNAFYYCPSLQTITVQPGNEAYQSQDGVLFTKDGSTLVAYPAAKPGETFEVPGSVTEIDISAFRGNRTLQRITVPDSVQEIGGYAFSCQKLEQIVLPNHPLSIGSDIVAGTPFYDNPDNWEEEALYCGNHLLDSRVTQGAVFAPRPGTLDIADAAFAKSELAKVVLPESLRTVGFRAFSDCKQLQEVVVESTNLTISRSAFLESGLQTVEFRGAAVPDANVCIDSFAFSDCWNLREVTLPAGVTNVAAGAFKACERLQDFIVAEENPTYKAEDGVLFSKDGSTLICYPSGRENGYTVPETVTTIASYAFTGSYRIAAPNYSLGEVHIPLSVTNIEPDAFNVSEITIYYEGTEEQWESFNTGYEAICEGKIPPDPDLDPDPDPGTGDVFATFQVSTVEGSVDDVLDVDVNIVDAAAPIGRIGFSLHYDETYLKLLKTEWTVDLDLATEGVNSAIISRDGLPLSGRIMTLSFVVLQEIPKGKQATVSLALSDDGNTPQDTRWQEITAPFAFKSGGVVCPGTLEDPGFASQKRYEKPYIYEIRTDDSDHEYAAIMYYDDDYDISGSLTVPSTLGGLPVEAIGECAFRGYYDLTSITVPDSVRIIEDYAFSYCEHLEKVTLPAHTLTIGAYILSGTAFADNPENWNAGALYCGNHLLEANADEIVGSFTARAGTLDIADRAFYNCSDCIEVKLQNSTMKIGEYAFAKCEQLESVTLSVAQIGRFAFSGCTALQEVTLSAATTVIGYEAFCDCTNLKSITLPSSATFEQSIGGTETYLEAFGGCDSLENIHVVAGSGTAQYSSVDGVVYNADQTRLYWCPRGKKGVYYIPSSCTSIAEFAFSDCVKLTEIQFPSSGIESVSEGAFENCPGLTSIILSKDCSLWFSSFRECEWLKTVYFSGTKAEWEDEEFQIMLVYAELPEDVTVIFQGDPTDEIAYGCITDDDKINAADALYILQYAVSKRSLTPEKLAAADVTGDGKVNAGDALYILQYAVGKRTSFPVQK